MFNLYNRNSKTKRMIASVIVIVVVLAMVVGLGAAAFM